MTTVTFGKYKNWDIKEVPSSYLDWGSTKLDSPHWRDLFNKEIDRRNKEQKKKEDFIKANIDSQEVWDLLLKEADDELIKEERLAEQENVQYNSRIITKKEIEELAKEKLADYKKEIAVENLKKEFDGKDGLTIKLLSKIEDIYYNIGLERSQFSSDSKYQLACEYMERLIAIRGW